MNYGLKPYTTYRNSSMPWLGDIPAHWTLQRLDRLFTLRCEPPQEGDQRVTAYLDGRVTLRSNVAGQKIKGVIKETGWQRVYPGDFAISGMNAHLGGVGVSDSLGKCSPIYLVLKPRSGVNAQFVSHVVRHIAHTGALKAFVNTIRFNSADFKRDDLKHIRVWLPSNDEQSAIIRFLDHADCRIRRYVRVKKRLIALLNEQKQASIRGAVTRSLAPNVRLKPSGVEWLGDVPEHWDIWKVGHFGRVGNGSTPSRGNPDYWNGGTYPWLNSSTVNRSRIAHADQLVTDLALKECHLPRVQPGSVLVAITGQGRTRGTSALLTIEATISQHIAYITPRPDVVLPEYLLLALVGAYWELRAISEDSGSTKGALTCGDIRHFKIAVPPRAEQAEIISAVRRDTQSTEAAIERTNREVAMIYEYLTRLVADVVTGKLDVREAAAQLPNMVEEPEPFVEDETLAEDDGELAEANFNEVPEEIEA